MLINSLILDIACRASNLSERSLILNQLAKRKNQVAYPVKLSLFDTWNINKMAGKLATQLVKESYREGKINKLIESDLRQLLIDYKLYELNLDSLSESDRLEFIKPYNLQWLKTYQAALATLELPRDNFSASPWYEPNIYYGKFAKVCEPFLRWLHNILQPVCDAANLLSSNYKINPQVVTDIQLHLLNRFEFALAWALEADINFYCAQNHLSKSASTANAYITYLEQTFHNQQDYHRFYCNFPVLGRWLAQVTYFLGVFGQELIQHVTKDRDEISEIFFNSRQISQVKSFNLGKSDCHAGSKSVAFLELELVNSEPATIVYKPRCIKSEVAMQDLLRHLNKCKVTVFPNYKVLCQDGYGYVEFIPYGQNRVQTEKEVERLYHQLGGYLGIFYIMGGGDLHFENILIADGNAFICDCETALEVIPRGMYRLSDTVFDSVFKTAMLEWPRTNATDPSNQMKISGYSGGESYQIPFAIPRINDHRMSLALAVEHKASVCVDSESTNRIYYKDRLVHPEDYKNCIVDGFNQVYSWFEQNSTQAISLLKKLFSGSSVRFLNRGTQAYNQLILAARHPKCLVEPLEVDLMFNSLKEYPRKWDEKGDLAELELAAMWQLDIPVFTAKAVSIDELVYNYQKFLLYPLALSPIDNVIRRIQKLSPENRTRQNQYIYASLSTNEINSPYFGASAVNYAQQIGWQLCEMLQPTSSKAPWKTYEFTATGKRFVDISADLYDGTAGICLFLAYLDAIQPQPEFRQVAERSLAYSIEQCNTKMIGAFQGATGLIYLLTHLAHLWNKPELLEFAVNLSHELILHISEDRYFDILHGVAGIIPVMLALAEATSGNGLDCAHLCAQHLLQQANRQNDTLSWEHHQPELTRGNLTGFSHGAGGIGWALISLGCYAQQSEYIVAGRQAFAYEATQFDSDEGDWYDLRRSVMTVDSNKPHFANAWCNGAAGIGLSRIASWAALGKTDNDILRDAYRALNTTLRNFDKLGNDSLCHGKAGNAELLVRFAKLKDEPYLQMEANVQTQAQWRNFEKNRFWVCGAGGNDVFPGLMLGLAGIGMHFLRLAYPERVPSPLLLDPPPK